MPTIYSERHGAPLHFGKQDAKPRRVGVRYEDDIRPELARLGLLPSVPQMFGHGHDLPQLRWKMLGNGPQIPGNDEGVIPSTWKAFLEAGGCGDCTIADCAHTLMEAEFNAGAQISAHTIESVVGAYSELGGYNPVTGANDNGLDIQAVVEWLMSKGMPDATGKRHIIEPNPVTLVPGNVQHLWEATWLFEKVKIGIVICEAQERQFNERAQPTWDWVPGSPELGGHDVPVVGKLGLLSWAEDVYYTPRFIENQCDEAIAVLHPEQFHNGGRDYEGFTQGDIQKFSVELAKERLGL